MWFLGCSDLRILVGVSSMSSWWIYDQNSQKTTTAFCISYYINFKDFIYKVLQIWPGLICVYVSTNQSRSYLNHLVHGKTAKLWLGDLPAGSFQVRNSHAAHFCYSFTVWIYRWSSVLLFSSEFRFCYRTAVSYICVM